MVAAPLTTLGVGAAVPRLALINSALVSPFFEALLKDRSSSRRAFAGSCFSVVSQHGHTWLLYSDSLWSLSPSHLTSSVRSLGGSSHVSPIFGILPSSLHAHSHPLTLGGFLDSVASGINNPSSASCCGQTKVSKWIQTMFSWEGLEFCCVSLRLALMSY